MKTKILLVRTTESNSIHNKLKISHINNGTCDFRLCTFGEVIPELPQYNFNQRINDFSIAGWIAYVNSSIVSIFDEFIPDTIILTGYNLTSVGAAIAAYFMGLQIYIYYDENFDNNQFNQFPMEKGLEILKDLVDYHFHITEEIANMINK